MSTLVSTGEIADLVNSGRVLGLVEYFNEKNKEDMIPESGEQASSPKNENFQENLNFFKNLETRTNDDKKLQSDRSNTKRETENTTSKSNFSLNRSGNVSGPELGILQTDRYLCSNSIFRSVHMSRSFLKMNGYQPIKNIPSSEEKMLCLKEEIKQLVKQIASRYNCANKRISEDQRLVQAEDVLLTPATDLVSLGLRSEANKETSYGLESEQSPKVSTKEQRPVQPEDDLLTPATELACGRNVEKVVSLSLRSEANEETSYGLESEQSPKVSTEEQRPVQPEDDLLTSSSDLVSGGSSQTLDCDADYKVSTTIHEVASKNETEESKNCQTTKLQIVPSLVDLVQTVKMRSMSYDGARTAHSKEFCSCCSQTLPARRNSRRKSSFCFGSSYDDENEIITNPKDVDVRCEPGSGGKCKKVSSKNRKGLPVGKRIYNKCVNIKNSCVKGSVKLIYTVNRYCHGKRPNAEDQSTQRNDDVFSKEEEIGNLPPLHETRLGGRHSTAEVIRRTFEQQYPSVSKYFQQRRDVFRLQETSTKEKDTSSKTGFISREKLRTFFRKRPDSSLLQTALRKLYSGWRNDLPTDFDLREIPLTYLFDLESTFPGKAPNHRGLSEDLISPSNPWRKIVVHGRPRFGKTCLFKCLAYHWSHKKFSVSEYKFCFYISLGTLLTSTAASLTEAIVESCLGYFSDRKVTKESVKEVLEEENESIVLLLDGYDELSEEGKQKLKVFLKCSPVFKSSTILVATRPDASIDLLDLFEVNVCISGFSAERLCWHLIVEKMDERSVSWLRSLTDNNVQMSKLSSLPSGCTFIMKKVLEDQQFSNMTCPSIYLILEQIMIYGIKHHNREQMAKNFLSRLKIGLMSLGKAFLDLLKDGRCIFEESLLVGIPGDILPHLINGVMFYKVKGNGNGWGFVSTIWQVFLSTYYLKHISETWKPSEKEKLFKHALCSPTCEGKYVQPSTCVPTEMYFKGSIPDIVIYLGNDCSWENAEVKMRHDTQISS